jgi:hypothetical protein
MNIATPWPMTDKVTAVRTLADAVRPRPGVHAYPSLRARCTLDGVTPRTLTRGLP